jgi:hypothetical protein
MDTNDKGDLAVLKVLLQSAQKNYIVSKLLFAEDHFW